MPALLREQVTVTQDPITSQRVFIISQVRWVGSVDDVSICVRNANRA